MKNLNDLNDHLFKQLERLSNENLDAEGLQREISRSHAVRDLAKEVISNANLVLDATIQLRDYRVSNSPALLGIENDKA